MRKSLAIAAIAVLAACNQAGEDAAPAPESTTEDVTAHVGAALVMAPDGNTYLSYSMADGTSYGAQLAKDFQPGTWSLEDGKSCVTPAGADKFCFTLQPANADGSIDVKDDDGKVLGSFVPLNMPKVAEGTVITDGPGASLVTPADGEPFLDVWTADGKIYSADNPQAGTWRSENGKRCGKSGDATEETCATPGPMQADGTFEATNDAGEKITVRFLS